MIRLLLFIDQLLEIYTLIIFASVIMSWLTAFGILSPYNPIVRGIQQGLDAVTEPFLGPIRRMLPATGGIDFSPIVLLLAVYFIRSVVIGNLIANMA